MSTPTTTLHPKLIDDLADGTAEAAKDAADVAHLLVNLREVLLAHHKAKPWDSHKLPADQRTLFDDINFIVDGLRTRAVELHGLAVRLANRSEAKHGDH